MLVAITIKTVSHCRRTIEKLLHDEKGARISPSGMNQHGERHFMLETSRWKLLAITATNYYRYCVTTSPREQNIMQIEADCEKLLDYERIIKEQQLLWSQNCDEDTKAGQNLEFT